MKCFRCQKLIRPGQEIVAIEGDQYYVEIAHKECEVEYVKK